MERIRDSIAWRLTVWFLLLSLLPIGVLVVFVRQSVTDTYLELGLQESQRQAVVLAEAAASAVEFDSLTEVLVRVGDERHTAFLLDEHGEYLGQRYPIDLHTNASDDFTGSVVEELLSGGDGSLYEPDTGRLIGYSTSADSGLIAVIVIDESVVKDPIYGLEREAAIQLGVSLAIVAVVGGLAIWIFIGPIRYLTRAAVAIGEGELDHELDQSEMEGELRVLARAFQRMVEQLRESYGALEQRVAARTKDLTALNSIASIMSRSLVLEEILDDALEKALEVLDFESGAIFLMTTSGGELQMANHRGLSEGFRQRVAKGLLSKQVADAGEPIIVEDFTAQDDTPDIILKEGYRAMASVPLTSKGRVEGVLTVANRRSHRFDSASINLITSIANQIGVAIENARLYENEHRRAEHFRVIGEVSRQITSILDVSELLGEITRLVADSFGFYIVHIGLIEDGGLVFRSGAAGKRQHPYDLISPIRLELDSQGITAWVARHGEHLLVPDVRSDARYLPVDGLPEIRSELAIPVRGRGELIGVLDIESDQLNAFDDDDVAVLQSLANQAGIAIQNAALYEQARRLAVLEERQRLARELHDSVTQEIYGVTMFAEAANRLLLIGEHSQAAEHMKELQGSAQEALGEMRLLIHELRPPVLEQVGLIGALQARLEAVEGRAGILTEFTTRGQGELPVEVQEGLYGIAREALNNALKHAQPRQLKVELDLDGSRASLSIADDGVGFDPDRNGSEGGLGLRSMQERASSLGGRLSVRSTPGEGTIVEVEVDR
jgi:signal transduction histidine kinase/HAMP domain-containing protein